MGIFKKAGIFFLDFIETVVMALAVFVIIYLFLFQPHQVRGSSMYPTFHDSEYVLTDKISYRLHQPRRGDIIIFRAPRNEEYDYIKRIIGLPGDLISLKNGSILINHQPLKESYLSLDSATEGGYFLKTNQEVLVPEGQYFVLGDNRNHSSDSREWGFVPKENIIGQAFFRYWPPSQIGLVSFQKE